MSDFYVKDVNAYEISGNTLKAFLPLVKKHTRNRQITAIAEIKADFDPEYSYADNVMIKTMKFLKVYYYNDYCEVGIYAGGHIRNIKATLTNVKQNFSFSVSPTLREEPAEKWGNTFFSDRQKAEQEVFGETKEPALTVSPDDFNDFSEDLLDIKLYLPFTNYYSYWGSICKTKGFILYRPCSNAHMSEYTVLENGYSYGSPIKKKYIFADKVVPIGFITCPIVAHETKDATAEYYEELDKGKIQRIPAFGEPVCFEFGTVFGTELYETHTVEPEKLENNVWHEV